MMHHDLQLQAIESAPAVTGTPAAIIAADVLAAATKLLVGPVVCREGGFAFDTFSCGVGTVQGFPYRRAEHADYDRKSTLAGLYIPRGLTAVACETAQEFTALREQLLLIGGGRAEPSELAN